MIPYEILKNTVNKDKSVFLNTGLIDILTAGWGGPASRQPSNRQQSGNARGSPGANSGGSENLPASACEDGGPHLGTLSLERITRDSCTSALVSRPRIKTRGCSPFHLEAAKPDPTTSSAAAWLSRSGARPEPVHFYPAPQGSLASGGRRLSCEGRGRTTVGNVGYQRVTFWSILGRSKSMWG